MKTSQQWWNETKASPTAIIEWLKKQYTGEVTAATRIIELGERFDISTKAKSILAAIAIQEETHAEWIKQLLLTRGVDPDVGDPNQRYWKETLSAIKDFETGTAVAAHAEKMRLERIEVISNDQSADYDIRSVFTNILKDELWHEKAFRSLSTEDALALTKENHENGARALGLVA